MPHHKSCKKRLKTSQERNERNRQNRAMMRTKIKQYRANIDDLSGEDKDKAVFAMYSLIDSQARKGLMPRNRADRLKARLAAAADTTE